MLSLSQLVKKKQYGSSLCDMQISYEMVFNAHVRHLTVLLTFRIPIDVENPGAALSPFSRGKAISP